MATIDVCEACGEGNPAGSAFCMYCGVYLGWDERDAERGPAPTGGPVSAPTGSPAGSATGSEAGPGIGSGAGSGPGSGPGTVGRQSAPRVEPATAQPAAIRAASSGERACPACGQPNGAARRFCGKCGQALRPTTGTTAAPAAPSASWWSRLWDPADRRARREYRRSLPPLYRWRRVLIGVLLIAGTVGLLTVVGRNPVGWVKARYHDARGSLVVVDPLVFTASPADSTANGYSVGALGSPEADDAWATGWSAGAMAPMVSCGAQKAARGMVTVTLPRPVRVRDLEILSGLPAEDDSRPFVFRPSRLLVLYGEGVCRPVELRDDSGVQRVTLDTGEPVVRLTIAVAAAYPARADAKQDLVALSGIKLLSRPN